MKVGIAYNAERVGAASAAPIAEALRSAGGEAVVFSLAEPFPTMDRLIVLGGDGAILHAAKHASALGIPLVGVNYGHVGFLTEYDRDEGVRAAHLCMREDAETLERSMLEAELGGKKAYLINELTLLRRVSDGHDLGVGKILAAIDGSDAGEFVADGLIVATPTGSTAYSLSAGGCIMTPDCPAFLLTPVCAVSSKARPIVFPDSGVITLSLFGEGELYAYGDGKFLGEMHAGDTITARKAERSALFLTESRQELFRRLTQKIN